MMRQVRMAAPRIGEGELQAVERVLRSGNLAQGAEVASFEEEFRNVVDGRECIAVNSGTSALHAALIALGIGRGDEVIVPAFTFAATANVVALVGATPVFVDIEPDTFCISMDAVRAALTAKTRAVIPVHLFGQPADMGPLLALAAQHAFAVLEDACQAHCATYQGKAVGSLGDAGAFSFYPTKNMTAGEGGMVSTSDANLARMVRLLRNQGMERRYENEVVGFNYRMTDIHAAIGRVQLADLVAFTRARQDNAAILSANLTGVVAPVIRAGSTHVFHQYSVRIEGLDRDDVAQELGRRGVGTGVFYPIPVNRLPSFGVHADLPATEAACSQVLSLPVHPGLDSDDLQYVIESVNAVVNAGG